MRIRVDYRCRSCDQQAEHHQPSPPPQVVTCGACGGDATRVWSPVSVVGRAGAGRRERPHGVSTTDLCLPMPRALVEEQRATAGQAPPTR